MANMPSAVETTREILSKNYPNEFDRAVDLSKVLTETPENEWFGVLQLVATTPREVAEPQAPSEMLTRYRGKIVLYMQWSLAQVATCIVAASMINNAANPLARFLRIPLQQCYTINRAILLYTWMGTSPLPLNGLTLQSRMPGAAGETRSWSVLGWSAALLQDRTVGR